MAAQLIRFEVPGRPVPQGSTRAFSRGSKIVTTNDPTGSIGKWRGDIRAAVGDLKPDRPVAGPVRMDLTFGLARPKSHYLPVTKSRAVPALRADAPAVCLSAPDTDKLERAVLDALADVVYLDDKQVFEVMGRKQWIEAGEPGLRAEVGFSDTIPTVGDVAASLIADPPAGQLAIDL